MGNVPPCLYIREKMKTRLTKPPRYCNGLIFIGLFNYLVSSPMDFIKMEGGVVTSSDILFSVSHKDSCSVPNTPSPQPKSVTQLIVMAFITGFLRRMVGRRLHMADLRDGINLV